LSADRVLANAILEASGKPNDPNDNSAWNAGALYTFHALDIVPIPAYTSFMASTLQSPCLCDALRQASRTVTRLYDDALRPVGLRITQFSILAYLLREGEVRVRDLGAGLWLEETTLTRSLRPLEQQGWVQIRAGEDRREKYISLTASGLELLKRAAPLWQSAQEQLRERVSMTTWDTMFRGLPKLAEAAAS
jgi:DNA-binding MarR family transcriptional regulator